MSSLASGAVRCGAESRPEILRWAMDCGLSDVLDEDISVFLAEVHLPSKARGLLDGMRLIGAVHDLRELLSGEHRPVERHLDRQHRREALDLEVVARLYLERRLAERRAKDDRTPRSAARQEAEAAHVTALDKEREVLALRLAPPRDLVLRDLAEKVWAARESARREAEPLPPERLADARLTWYGEPDRLVFTAEDIARRTSSKYWVKSPRVETEIPLLHWRREGLRPHCDCRDEPGSCGHVLAALDVLLRWIHLGADESLMRFAAAIGTPDWAIALRSLDAALEGREEAATGGAERLLSWRFEPRGGSLPLVHPFLHRRSVKGGWTRGARLSTEDLRSHPAWLCHPADGEVLDRVEDAIRLAWSSTTRAQAKRFEALDRLVGHPRVYASGRAPVAIRRSRFEVVAVTGADGSIEIVPTLDGDPETAEALWDSGPAPFVARFDEASATLRLARIPAQAQALLAALAPLRPAFPPESHGELLRRLSALEAVVPVRLPDGLAGERVEASSLPLFRLRARPDGGLHAEVRIRPLPGAPIQTPGEGPVRVVSLREGRRVYADRDLAREAAAVTAAVVGLPGFQGAARDHEETDLERALDLLVALGERSAAGTLSVEWFEEETPWNVSRPAAGGDLRVRVTDRRDWFGLDGDVTIDGETVSLGRVLEVVRKGGRYVPVSPGRFVVIGEELRRRLTPAADLAFEGRSGVVIAPAAAPALEDLADLAREARVCGSYRLLRERLASARALDPAPPEPLATVLRPYQIEGFCWLARLAAWGVGACLADDMGLGKTLQALAVLVTRAPLGPALVLAPTSVCFNWEREARRFAPSLRMVAWRTADREGTLAGLGPGDVLVASYALLVRDAERLCQARFSTLVLDEAQAVKNAATRRARAVRDLDADWRFALTGTPVENHLGELWSLFRILTPGLLGSWEQFRDRFAAPIERGKDPRRREALARVVRPFILRRTKQEVAPELPSRTEVVLPISLSPEERRLYDGARAAAAARLQGLAAGAGAERARFEILSEITRLRQLACHPRLVDPESRIGSAKLERLVEVIDTLREEGHRVLVFSQFVRHLALAREALAGRGVRLLSLDGGTPAAERARLVDAFQRGEGDVFLISLRAGGTGLNLTAADYVVHLDPWWNPAVEDQATDRAHRIGQEKPVTVYRLVSTGTIEEAILDLHQQKRDLVEGILAGGDAAARLSAAELLLLLRRGPDEGPGEPDDRLGEETDPAGEALAGLDRARGR